MLIKGKAIGSIKMVYIGYCMIDTYMYCMYNRHVSFNMESSILSVTLFFVGIEIHGRVRTRNDHLHNELHNTHKGTIKL